MDEKKKVNLIQETRINIGQIRKMLDLAILRGYLTNDDTVLWADMVQEGSDWMREQGCPVGSLLLGIAKADGNFGTLRVEPKAVSPYLN